MNIRQCMKQNVISLDSSATIGEAARLFVQHHVGTLPVVDDDGRLIGILHLRDLIQLVMPAFTKLLEDFDFVLKDFGEYEASRPSPEVVTRPVVEVMEEAVWVQIHSGLLRAFALLDEHDLYDLPVVDEAERLVGLASRVDIGTALMAQWQDNAGASDNE